MDAGSRVVYSQPGSEAWQLFLCIKCYKIYSYAAGPTSGTNFTLFMSSQS